MSLEAERSDRRQASFLVLVFGVQKGTNGTVGKWESLILAFPLFHWLVAAVGMWESQQRFPRAVGSEGNLGLVFLTVHQTVISTAVFGNKRYIINAAVEVTNK